MNIAALSISLNQGRIQQQAGLSVMKMAMGVTAEKGNAIVSMANDNAKNMALSVQPYLGANLDIQA